MRYADSGDKARRLDVVFDGPCQTFNLGTEKIAYHFLEPVDGRLLDFMEIAAAVFSADCAVRRGGETHSGHGEGWRREFHFEVAVRDPGFWSRAEVTDAIVQAVSFLTDDHVAFEFRESAATEYTQPYFDFSEDSTEPFQADEVVMYSGGLDSVAGILELLETTKKRLALVTHRSAPKLITRQRFIFEQLRRRYPGRLLWIEVNATRFGQKRQAPETTQRSRSFLFSALGMAVARMFGAQGVTFFENGVVSQNLPISGNIAGTLATRTTHPQAMRHLSTLATLIAEQDFEICNPFVWQTKAEVVERFRTFHTTDLIEHTVSCNNVRGRSGDKHHCGACNQCLDRTFALYAAGLEEHATPEDFETVVLTGTRADWRSRTIAVEWIRHAVELADMDELAFLERYSTEAARVARGFVGLSAQIAMAQIFDLQHRHGMAVRKGLGHAIRGHSQELASGRIPSSSLLRMHLSSTNGNETLDTAPRPRRRERLPLVRQPEAVREPQDGGLPLQVEFVSARHVKVRYLADVVGDRAEVVTRLKDAFDADRKLALPIESCRYIPCREISDDMDADETTVRQHIKRIRDTLREAWCGIHDTPPKEQLLIQTRSGYRLDPTIHVIRTGHVD